MCRTLFKRNRFINRKKNEIYRRRCSIPYFLELSQFSLKLKKDREASILTRWFVPSVSLTLQQKATGSDLITPRSSLFFFYFWRQKLYAVSNRQPHGTIVWQIVRGKR